MLFRQSMEEHYRNDLFNSVKSCPAFDNLKPAYADKYIATSMLQKAVRRGAHNLVITTSALLESFGPKEKNWLRKRTSVITFEECWPLATDLMFNKTFHSKVAALVKVARSLKDKDAAGLGSLAHALADGDRSVLDGLPDDKDIKIVASAVSRPEDFWNWVGRQKTSSRQEVLIKNAVR